MPEAFSPRRVVSWMGPDRKIAVSAIHDGVAIEVQVATAYSNAERLREAPDTTARPTAVTSPPPSVHTWLVAVNPPINRAGANLLQTRQNCCHGR
jgi:hypothetical protein